MKTFLTAIALAATAISFPAFAEGDIGCDRGESLMASPKQTTCELSSLRGSTMWSPPLVASSAFAFVPPRIVTIAEPWPVTFAASRRGLVDIDEDDDLEGGSD